MLNQYSANTKWNYYIANFCHTRINIKFNFKIIKFIKKSKITRKTRTILKKKNKMGQIYLSVFKTFY